MEMIQDEVDRNKANEGREEPETAPFRLHLLEDNQRLSKPKDQESYHPGLKSCDTGHCLYERAALEDVTYFCLLLTEAKGDNCQGCWSLSPRAMSLQPGIVEQEGAVSHWVCESRL